MAINFNRNNFPESIWLAAIDFMNNPVYVQSSKGVRVVLIKNGSREEKNEKRKQREEGKEKQESPFDAAAQGFIFHLPGLL